MKAGQVIITIQALLGIPPMHRAPRVGPLTRTSLDQLGNADPDTEWPPSLGVAVPATKEPSLPTPPSGVHRQISPLGLLLVKHFESLYLAAYQDSVGVWTIGWGHTGLTHRDGTVFRGRTITQAQAANLLAYDMHQFETRVQTLVKVPLTDDQFAALVAFDFNTGGLTLDGGKPSTLLRKLNAGDYTGAANELLKWDKAGGRVLKGLTRRRLAENNLFLSNYHAVTKYTEGQVVA